MDRNEPDIGYLRLKDKFDAFAKGELSSADLKHDAAPFGVYEQRDGLFMARVRITAGHLDVGTLRFLAAVTERNGGRHAHLSTRQDIQLHGVPAPSVFRLMCECAANGLPFKGGGGNTMRNICASAPSGVSPESVFDVVPYAQETARVLFACAQAFMLPRKYKIGFSALPADDHVAAFQDLGFVAVIVAGHRGFSVYGGGGMGSQSSVGVQLLDFIPAAEAPRCALALAMLFYDHGDRENRNKARIRFILKRLGQDAFVKLFHDYLVRAAPVSTVLPSALQDLAKLAGALKVFTDRPPDDSAYCDWLKYAVSPTAFGEDVVSVRLFVPCGNLTPEEMVTVSDLADLCGCPFVRLTTGQDILLPLVSRSALPIVYRFARHGKGSADMSLQSFRGHLVSCVGATVCKLGLLDSTAMADAIAMRLDDYFLNKADLKAEFAVKILDMVKISGCANACSAHPAACVGLQGQKRKLGEEMVPAYRFFGKCIEDKRTLAIPEEELTALEDVPDKVLDKLMMALWETTGSGKE